MSDGRKRLRPSVPLPAAARAGFALAPALVALLGSASARAGDEANQLFRLAWVRSEGAEGCIDQPGLEAGVRARLGREPFASAAPASIEGEVGRFADAWRAKLRVRDGGGALLGQRALEIRGDDCAQLSEAIVLAVALTIDPNAPTQASSPPSPIVTSPIVAQPSAPPLANAVATQPEGAPELGCPVVAPRGEASAVSACPPLTAPSSFGLTARALGAVRVLPGLAPGAALVAGFGRPPLRWTVGMSWLPETTTSDGTFSFGLTAANAGACFEFTPAPDAQAGLCADVEAGAIHALARKLEPLDPGDTPWLALRAGPRFAWQFVSPFLLELGALAVAPLIRPEFAVRGVQEPVFESGQLGVVAFFGVGVGFY